MIIVLKLFRIYLFQKLILSKLMYKTLTISFIFLMSPNVFSVSQDYLRLLEAEAEAEIEIEMNDELEQTSIENNNEQELILNKRKLINNQQDFEQALKKGFPESYDLYKDLNNTKKETIYSNFKIHKRLYNSSVNIISMYLSTH